MNIKLNNKNILITGGTGQIGSFLVEDLINSNAKISILGRNSTNLKELKPLVESNKIKFIEYNVTNEKHLELIHKDLAKINYLVHLRAAMSHPYQGSFENAHFYINLNLINTIKLLSLLNNIEGILYSSSISVYGTPTYLPIDENCPTKPISFYGCAKLGEEKYLQLFCNSKHIPLTILRYSGVYGPRNRTNRALPSFIHHALNDEPITLHGKGKTFIDLIYISDVINATKLAMTKNENDIYNIGSGIKCTIYELAQKIIELLNSKSRIVLSDNDRDFNYVYDISKAKTKLGFYPIISLERGLKNEIFWHKENIK